MERHGAAQTAQGTQKQEDQNSRVSLGEGPKQDQQMWRETGTRRTETWGTRRPPTGAPLTSWKSACPAAGAECRGGWGAGGPSRHTVSSPAHAMALRLARLRAAVPRLPRLAGGGARAHWPKHGPAPTWPRFPCLEESSKRGEVKSHQQ